MYSAGKKFSNRLRIIMKKTKRRSWKHECDNNDKWPITWLTWLTPFHFVGGWGKGGAWFIKEVSPSLSVLWLCLQLLLVEACLSHLPLNWPSPAVPSPPSLPIPCGPNRATHSLKYSHIWGTFKNLWPLLLEMLLKISLKSDSPFCLPLDHCNWIESTTGCFCFLKSLQIWLWRWNKWLDKDWNGIQ